jgi:hypothetical protein
MAAFSGARYQAETPPIPLSKLSAKSNRETAAMKPLRHVKQSPGNQVAIFRSSAAVGPPTADEYPEEDDNGHFYAQLYRCIVPLEEASQSVKNQLNETL